MRGSKYYLIHCDYNFSAVRYCGLHFTSGSVGYNVSHRKF